MAGFFLIAEDTKWSVSTVAFESIVELTRLQLDSNDQTTLDEAYQPVEQGFDCIVLDELDKSGFRLFCHKCRKAFDEYTSSESPDASAIRPDPGLVEVWRELLELLSRDDRYDP